ncbi:MAG: branched-chain amino acid ABC transporter permease [Acidimicrobiia bacterium]|nr:branched-chain amino acid ABC transporter permease [Acidimicrobiia bacterium]
MLGSLVGSKSMWRITSLLLLAALFLLPALGALGQSAEGVRARLTYEDPESGTRTPAVGVAFTVTDLSGAAVGEGVTDIEGNVEIPVPGAGEYLLVIDVLTLPEGIGLLDEARGTAQVSVLQGRVGSAIFALTTGGETDVQRRVTVRRVSQLTVEGLKLGLFLGMAAIGLSLIFGTTGLVNFAHSEMIVFGMLVAYFFNFYGFAGVFGFMEGWPAPFGAGINLIPAALIAVLAGGMFGWALDRYLFGPLRRRGVSLIAAMVVTIGLSIFVRYIFLFLFGGSPRFFRDYTAQSGMQIGIIDITPKDLATAIISIAVLVAVGLFLGNTKLGKAMRAVSDNRDLAESSGIDVQRVISRVWVAGGALAALGGVFIGLSEQVSWNIGFRILLLIFAAVVLGGLGTAYGALVGALVVGVGIQVSTIYLPTELKNVGALVLLILVLVIRPQGILGRAERVG